MKRVFFCKFSLLIMLGWFAAGTLGAQLNSGNRIGNGAPDRFPPTALRVSDERNPADPGIEPMPMINLKSLDGKVQQTHGRALWTELNIQNVATSSQGLVDAIMGPDGYVYIAYFDDQEPAPGYNAVYTKRSGDGGATWENPDGGANGFALYGLFMDRPSIEVFEASPGNYRMTVAVSAPWPTQTSPNDIIIAWKDIGAGDDFTTVSIQNDTSENYLIPRLKAVTRPSNPSLKRLLCASYSYSDGRLWCDRSDTNGTSWGSYAAINPGTDQEEVWRGDFIEDTNNSRVFCVWSVGVSAAPDNPAVLMALSTDQGQNWFADLYRMAPSSWDSCSEADAAISVNPLQTDRTLMIAWTGRELSTENFGIYYSYQFLDAITVAGSTWDPSPTGFPVNWGAIYTDADYSNTMPAIVEDNRLTVGGFRVAFVDQHLAASAQMRYSECTFDTPVSWMAADVISSPGADPARPPSTALSSGVGYNAGVYSDRRCAVWPDFRSGSYFDMYAAYADMNATPVPTASPTGIPSETPTATPEISPTPVPTGSATPVPSATPVEPSATPEATSTAATPSETPGALPATGPVGTSLLIVGLSFLLVVKGKKKLI